MKYFTPDMPRERGLVKCMEIAYKYKKDESKTIYTNSYKIVINTRCDPNSKILW